jgi:hypothetical protein
MPVVSMVALVDVGVGMGVVTELWWWWWWRCERGVIVDSGHSKELGVGAEFESMMKMKSENESEND